MVMEKQHVEERGVGAPLVSVCIPTYCRYGLLRRALESVLSQNFAEFEVIISDNASTDGSWERTRALAETDRRVKVRRNERNLGWTGNLNECIKASSGKYLVFLCDDDELLPGMLAACTEFLNANAGAGFVHTAGYAVGFSGRKVLVSSNPGRPVLLKGGAEALSATGLAFDILFSSVMSRRECYDSMGGFVESISADYEMWSRISAKYDVGYINRPFVKVHAHAISPKMTPERYIAESIRLKELVLPLFPPEIRSSRELLKKSDAHIAVGLRSLGGQAMHAGYWGRGLEFLAAARKYDPAYGRCSWLRDILRALPRRLHFMLFSRRITSTHV